MPLASELTPDGSGLLEVDVNVEATFTAAGGFPIEPQTFDCTVEECSMAVVSAKGAVFLGVTVEYFESTPLAFESNAILPGGAAVTEGDSVSIIVEVPVRLKWPALHDVTVDYQTIDDTDAAGVASAGEDFVATSGTATIPAGEVETTVSIEVFSDTDVEEPLLWGEWGLIRFSNSIGASIDTSAFFGVGVFVIIDDD